MVSRPVAVLFKEVALVPKLTGKEALLSFVMFTVE